MLWVAPLDSTLRKSPSALIQPFDSLDGLTKVIHCRIMARCLGDNTFFPIYIDIKWYRCQLHLWYWINSSITSKYCCVTRFDSSPKLCESISKAFSAFMNRSSSSEIAFDRVSCSCIRLCSIRNSSSWSWNAPVMASSSNWNESIALVHHLRLVIR